MTKYNYKNPISITSQFSFCGMSFRLDTYSGCGFHCSYCFAHRRGGNSSYNGINIADPDLIINRFKRAFEKPNITTGLISQYIRKKVPIHFGGMSDPFPQIEVQEQVSLKVLKYLFSINYPVVISTKSVLLSKQKYLQVLKKNPNTIVQYSFSSLNEKYTNIIEPNSPSPSERLRAIKTLSENGVKVMIRWQPYIIGISEKPVEFVKKISGTGINHLIIEFLKLPIDNKLAWENSLKPFRRIRDIYKNKMGRVIGRELVLPAKEKIHLIKELQAELNKYSISLGVGENDLQHLSSTKSCCGVDKFDGFEKWNKYQFSYAITNAKDNFIKFDSIRNKWKPSGAIDKYLNSKTRLKTCGKHNEVSDYLHNRWENIKSEFNPTKYHGVEDSGLRDKNGFRIFVLKDNLKG